jgi:hypothetical protein
MGDGPKPAERTHMVCIGSPALGMMARPAGIRRQGRDRGGPARSRPWRRYLVGASSVRAPVVIGSPR